MVIPTLQGTWSADQPHVPSAMSAPLLRYRRPAARPIYHENVGGAWTLSSEG
jgi:hypothetical protein